MQINSDHKWLKRVIRGQSSWIFVFLITIFWNPRGGLKKAVRLTTLHLHHTFLYPSLPSLHDSVIRRECAEFHGGGKHKTTTFFFFPFFFPLTSMQTLGFNPWKICKHLTIWRRWDNREFTFKWQVQLRHVIYVWLVILSYLFLILVPNMVLAKMNILTSRATYKANIWHLHVSTPYEFLVHAIFLVVG